jgi:hypothetical protein
LFTLFSDENIEASNNDFNSYNNINRNITSENPLRNLSSNYEAIAMSSENESVLTHDNIITNEINNQSNVSSLSANQTRKKTFNIWNQILRT